MLRGYPRSIRLPPRPVILPSEEVMDYYKVTHEVPGSAKRRSMSPLEDALSVPPWACRMTSLKRAANQGLTDLAPATAMSLVESRYERHNSRIEIVAGDKGADPKEERS